MASPPHSEKAHEDCRRLSEEEEEKEAKDKDWLELGLGFGIACRKKGGGGEDEGIKAGSGSASSQRRQAKAKENPTYHECYFSAGLELGLSLGIDIIEARPVLGLELDHHNDEQHGVVRRLTDMAPPAAAAGNIINYDQSLWQNQAEDQDYDDELDDDDGDYDDDISWWPCDMNSGSCFVGLDHDDWRMPVPNNISHDYSSTSRTRTRPHSSGLWFTLQSYTNRNGEALPQIPKAYIRVKDENVTVFMVMKYLVRKLGLSNEAEVDISCMGQKLLHTLTLKQVRDCVWLPRARARARARARLLVDSINPTPTTDDLSFQNNNNNNYSQYPTNSVNHHLMSLQYGRPCTFN